MPIHEIERLRGYYEAIRDMPDEICSDVQNGYPGRIDSRLLWIYTFHILVLKRFPVIVDDEGNPVNPIDFYKQQRGQELCQNNETDGN